MKTNELRIGNYLYSSIGDAILIVEELTNENIITKVIDRKKYPLPDGWNAEGIIITKEWLSNINIEKLPFIFYGKENDLYIVLENGNRLIIKYIHQLQNLYFILTGEELEVKIGE